MKRFTLLLSLALLSACAPHSAAQSGGNAQTLEAGDVEGLAVAPVFVPPLPGELDFAGEGVPLRYADVREALERELTVTMFMHSRSLRTLRLTTRYFPVIEPILEKYGVPNDFKYLCMAESNLDPNAVSPAKASGLWQIMVSAGRDYGLEVGDQVDMRYHVARATEAACKYLLAAYKRYGSWTMAAASYNCGMAGASRRIEAQGVNDYYDLFLPEETMRYLFRILSFKLVTLDPAPYGFVIRPEEYYPPLEHYKEVTVNAEQIDWSAFAARQGTTYRMLRVLNPWIRDYTFSNKSRRSYTVLIPTEGFREKGF